MPRSNEADDHADRDAHAAHAGFSAHDLRVPSNAIKYHALDCLIIPLLLGRPARAGGWASPHRHGENTKSGRAVYRPEPLQQCSVTGQYNAVVALSPMYPPTDRAGMDGQKVAFRAYVFLGLGYLLLAGFQFFASHNAKGAILNVEVASCFWLQAILLKAGMTTKTRLLITAMVLLAVSGIDWAVGII
jgi:hypothetical protein